MTALPDSPLRVLLIEDDDAFAAFMAALVGGARDQVVLDTVPSLHAAQAALATSRFDAILLDLGLPDSQGIETVGRMLALAPDVPIIVLTAQDDEQMAVQSLQRGAEDYLVKGHADLNDLRRSILHARERVTLRRALLEHESRLRQAHKMEAVGRLAGGVAHDFNNVLTAILGYTDLLLDQFPDGDQRRADLAEIRRSAERAAALTRQLLAFGRKQVMRPCEVDLNSVVAGTKELLARLVGEGIVIDIQLEPEPWRVLADPGQIEQVLINLAANARDAMSDGGRLTVVTSNVELTAAQVEGLPGLQPGAYVALAVSDTGEGIPAAARPYIFEPFFTTREQGKGTGLGLATVYGIVKQTGGGVYLASDEEKGTRIVVYLPRVP